MVIPSVRTEVKWILFQLSHFFSFCSGAGVPWDKTPFSYEPLQLIFSSIQTYANLHMGQVTEYYTRDPMFYFDPLPLTVSQHNRIFAWSHLQHGQRQMYCSGEEKKNAYEMEQSSSICGRNGVADDFSQDTVSGPRLEKVVGPYKVERVRWGWNRSW